MASSSRESSPTGASPIGVSAQRLLDWFDLHRRSLPWREVGADGRRDPYRVWLAEIMLQQTSTAAVAPYYRRFTARLPSLAALAAADRETVLALWSGLGYYRRAHWLHDCARLAMAEHGGDLPRRAAQLRTLPGIGAYTAAAIAAIAFGERICPLDGNAVRVLARLTATAEPPDKARRRLEPAAQRLTPRRRPGDFAEAIMDLGATVCRPRKPHCRLCPWREECRAAAAGNPEAYPSSPPRRHRPRRHGAIFVVRDEREAVFLTRPQAGRTLLAGLWSLPSTAWLTAPPEATQIAAARPFSSPPSSSPSSSSGRRPSPEPVIWRREREPLLHEFTHFRLQLTVYSARLARRGVGDGERGGFWVAREDLDAAPLASLTRKALAAAADGSDARAAAAEKDRP